MHLNLRVAGTTSGREFDNFDQIAKEVQPSPAAGKPKPVVRYLFDHQDQLVGVIDPRRLVTRYSVDGHGQRTALVSPDTGRETIIYDDAGNRVSSRDARHVTTTIEYDAARRATRIGNVKLEYGRDGASAAGLLAAMTDDSGHSTFSYDDQGRVQSKVQSIGNGPEAKLFPVVYQYGTSGSGIGHVSSMTYPSGNRIDIAYDINGRASSLTLVARNGGKSTTILSDVSYIPFGQVKGWTWGNGPGSPSTLSRREFDTAGRIKSYPLGSVGASGTARTLSYDEAGRITSAVHTGMPNAKLLDQRYAYDDLDRLIGVEGANVSQAFEYDGNGNRVKVRFGARSYSSTIHRVSNRLIRAPGPARRKANTFDNAGNLIGDGNAKFVYGADGRLSSVEAAGYTTSYRYNGFRNRV